MSKCHYHHNNDDDENQMNRIEKNPFQFYSSYEYNISPIDNCDNNNNNNSELSSIFSDIVSSSFSFKN